MPCPVQKPKTIIFDWDDTLADTRLLGVGALEKTLAEYGLPAWDIIKTQKRDPNKSLKENFVHFFGADEEEAYQKYLILNPYFRFIFSHNFQYTLNIHHILRCQC